MSTGEPEKHDLSRIATNLVGKQNLPKIKLTPAPTTPAIDEIFVRLDERVASMEEPTKQIFEVEIKMIKADLDDHYRQFYTEEMFRLVGEDENTDWIESVAGRPTKLGERTDLQARNQLRAELREKLSSWLGGSSNGS